MENIFIQAFISLVFGSIGGSVIGFIFFKKRSRWEDLRQACLDALNIVDSVYSNREWRNTGSNTPLQIEKQPLPNIAEVRRVYNHLSITCRKTETLSLYHDCVGTGRKGIPSSVSGDIIVRFRKAIRKELRFWSVEMDRDAAFIALLHI